MCQLSHYVADISPCLLNVDNTSVTGIQAFDEQESVSVESHRYQVSTQQRDEMRYMITEPVLITSGD